MQKLRPLRCLLVENFLCWNHNLTGLLCHFLGQPVSFMAKFRICMCFICIYVVLYAFDGEIVELIVFKYSGTRKLATRNYCIKLVFLTLGREPTFYYIICVLFTILLIIMTFLHFRFIYFAISFNYKILNSFAMRITIQ